MKVFTPPMTVIQKITASSVLIRHHKPIDLFNQATFRIAGPFMTLFKMGGITFHKDYIVLSKALCESDNCQWQAKIIFHELVHVAQQKDWGWSTFMSQYLWEWVSSGFSYERMKEKSIEKEAYALADYFWLYG